MYKQTKNCNEPSAFITNPKDRGRKKIYLNSKIYLDDNQEFEIELFNPTNDSILAEIKINGKLASSTGLVLKPGQRYFLDCFIDDGKKFVFKTYEVENTNQSLNAIANNGFVEISFYKEKFYNNYRTLNDYWIINSSPKYYDYINPFYTTCNSVTISNLDGGTINSCTILPNINLKNVTYTSSLNPTIETGRIEKGNKSNQKFENINMDFETYCINKISYQLLPNSKKPIETSEIKKNKFCTECGTRINSKYCGDCGRKA